MAINLTPKEKLLLQGTGLSVGPNPVPQVDPMLRVAQPSYERQQLDKLNSKEVEVDNIIENRWQDAVSGVIKRQLESDGKEPVGGTGELPRLRDNLMKSLEDNPEVPGPGSAFDNPDELEMVAIGSDKPMGGGPDAINPFPVSGPNEPIDDLLDLRADAIDLEDLSGIDPTVRTPARDWVQEYLIGQEGTIFKTDKPAPQPITKKWRPELGSVLENADINNVKVLSETQLQIGNFVYDLEDPKYATLEDMLERRPSYTKPQTAPNVEFGDSSLDDLLASDTYSKFGISPGTGVGSILDFSKNASRIWADDNPEIPPEEEIDTSSMTLRERFADTRGLKENLKQPTDWSPEAKAEMTKVDIPLWMAGLSEEERKNIKFVPQKFSTIWDDAAKNGYISPETNQLLNDLGWVQMLAEPLNLARLPKQFMEGKIGTEEAIQRSTYGALDMAMVDFARTAGKAAVKGSKSLPDDTLRILLGENNKLADQASLVLAKRLDELNAHPDQVLKSSGWQKNPETGTWWYEISDAGVDGVYLKLPKNFKQDTTLGEIYHHPELYKAYPELKDMVVKFDYFGEAGSPTAAASFVRMRYPDTGEFAPWAEGNQFIDIVPEMSKTTKDMKSYLGHEVQHAVDDLEAIQRDTRVPVTSPEEAKRALQPDIHKELTTLSTKLFRQPYTQLSTAQQNLVRYMADQVFNHQAMANYLDTFQERVARVVQERMEMSKGERVAYPVDRDIDPVGYHNQALGNPRDTVAEDVLTRMTADPSWKAPDVVDDGMVRFPTASTAIGPPPTKVDIPFDPAQQPTRAKESATRAAEVARGYTLDRNYPLASQYARALGVDTGYGFLFDRRIIDPTSPEGKAALFAADLALYLRSNAPETIATFMRKGEFELNNKLFQTDSLDVLDMAYRKLSREQQEIFDKGMSAGDWIDDMLLGKNPPLQMTAREATDYQTIMRADPALRRMEEMYRGIAATVREILVESGHMSRTKQHQLAHDRPHYMPHVEGFKWRSELLSLGRGDTSGLVETASGLRHAKRSADHTHLRDKMAPPIEAMRSYLYNTLMEARHNKLRADFGEALSNSHIPEMKGSITPWRKGAGRPANFEYYVNGKKKQFILEDPYIAHLLEFAPAQARYPVINGLRQIYQQLTTGRLAITFLDKMVPRETMLGAVLRYPGTEFGWADGIVQAMTGGKLGLRGDMTALGQTFVGGASGIIARSRMDLANKIRSSVLANPNGIVAKIDRAMGSRRFSHSYAELLANAANKHAYGALERYGSFQAGMTHDSLSGMKSATESMTTSMGRYFGPQGVPFVRQFKAVMDTVHDAMRIGFAEQNWKPDMSPEETKMLILKTLNLVSDLGIGGQPVNPRTGKVFDFRLRPETSAGGKVVANTLGKRGAAQGLEFLREGFIYFNPWVKGTERIGMSIKNDPMGTMAGLLNTVILGTVASYGMAAYLDNQRRKQGKPEAKPVIPGSPETKAVGTPYSTDPVSGPGTFMDWIVNGRSEYLQATSLYFPVDPDNPQLGFELAVPPEFGMVSGMINSVLHAMLNGKNIQDLGGYPLDVRAGKSPDESNWELAKEASINAMLAMVGITTPQMYGIALGTQGYRTFGFDSHKVAPTDLGFGQENRELDSAFPITIEELIRQTTGTVGEMVLHGIDTAKSAQLTGTPVGSAVVEQLGLDFKKKMRTLHPTTEYFDLPYAKANNQFYTKWDKVKQLVQFYQTQVVKDDIRSRVDGADPSTDNSVLQSPISSAATNNQLVRSGHLLHEIKDPEFVTAIGPALKEIFMTDTYGIKTALKNRSNFAKRIQKLRSVNPGNIRVLGPEIMEELYKMGLVLEKHRNKQLTMKEIQHITNSQIAEINKINRYILNSMNKFEEDYGIDLNDYDPRSAPQ